MKVPVHVQARCVKTVSLDELALNKDMARVTAPLGTIYKSKTRLERARQNAARQRPFPLGESKADNRLAVSSVGARRLCSSLALTTPLLRLQAYID